MSPHSPAPAVAGSRPVLRLDTFALASADTDQLAQLDAPNLTWIPAVVPGGVHESLIANGTIGHPYYGENEHDVRWVEDKTWWYRTSFEAPTDLADDERLQLVCPALDTVASLWLNGRLLGEHATQFRPAVFDITGLVHEDNVLHVAFSPPLAGLTAPAGVTDTVSRMKAMFSALTPDQQPDPDASMQPPGIMSADLALTLRRKGTFSWGWDFAPRVASIGIARPLEILRERAVKLTGHHIRATSVDVSAQTAEVAIDVEAEAFAHAGPLRAVVTLTSPGGRIHTAAFDLHPSADGATQAGSATVAVEQAELWWTHDLGPQALYTAVVELCNGQQEVLDRSEDHIGLRTVSLDRSADDEGGRLFRFLLNGTPTFSRGANWIPASMLTGSVTADTVHALVDRARQGNMTMLRVWGGGLYEQDAFYAACDELGVLVWQDFMFACIDYPSEDPVLHAEVVREAEYQVKRLRNRACLAVWAGNNEVHAIHGLVYGDTYEPGNWGWSFFHDVLPSAVERFSPEVPYWPGSPWGDSDPHGVNGVADGDRHAWEVWHGIDVGAGGPSEFASRGEAVHFHRYRYDTGKFISEFGIHAAPERATLDRWTPPGSLALHSPQFDHRNKDVPKNKGDDLMSVETGLPTDLSQYVDYSMACQAEGLKFGVEHYRRRQPHCSGTLIWQFNDPWPGLSWSVIDHDLVPKAGYYFAQRAYRTVLSSFRTTDDGTLELWVTNSGRNQVTLDLRVEVTGFTGEEFLGAPVHVTATPNSSQCVWSASAAVYKPGPDRYAWVSDAAGLTEPNRTFFAPLKDLLLPESALEIRIGNVQGGSAEITLVSHGYSYLARVLAPAPGVVFSRNYLDLRDGDQARITVSGLPDGFDAHQLQTATYQH